MAKGQNAVRLLLSGSARPARDPAAQQCRCSVHRRTMASAAVAVDEQSMSPPPSQAESQSPRPFYKLRAGVILSRPPQITRDLSSFEKAFYLYQRRLNERLSLPFTKYFYFQKDTPAELDFKRKLKERQTMARDIGTYAPYSPEGWNDEVKVGSAESEPSHQMEALWNDSQSTTSASGDAEEIAAAQKQSEAKQLPSPRVTDADHQNDQQSLNRALQRTLHLLVQNQASQWVFPDDGLLEKESLQTAAKRILSDAAGVNMNTWVVGSLPVGHGTIKAHGKQITADGTRNLGNKVFFMKARIMAGQADLAANKFGFKDFRWLTKEEISRLVTPNYWNNVQNILSQQ